MEWYGTIGFSALIIQVSYGTEISFIPYFYLNPYYLNFVS